MRICFVGPANSEHIKKWCKWFVKNDHEVHVISFTRGDIPDVLIHFLDIGVDATGKEIGKYKYLLAGRKVRAEIQRINPDIVNAHYASSYGIMMSLTGEKNYILSMWGSDIFEFPQKSILHAAIIRRSLKYATYLFSTSRVMAKEANKYTCKKIEITPFGVDMELFNPQKRSRKKDNQFIVGTVKTMSDNYGINTIIEATNNIRQRRPDIPILVRLAGDGPQLDHYRNIVREYNLTDTVTFLGQISQNEAAVEWANMDVAVIPSLQESFGVAAIEAQASGVPVIVSKAPGLLETTKPGITSIVVDAKDVQAITQSICDLYDNKTLHKNMSAKAIEFARNQYDLDVCFKNIERLYMEIINNNLNT